MLHKILLMSKIRRAKLFKNIQELIIEHVKTNFYTYIFLIAMFTFGLVLGAFRVNGLDESQKTELENYLNGFFHLLQTQKIDNLEIFKHSLFENLKIILLLWISGATVIGIPFIIAVICIKGFITGFCVGFIINTFGPYGILFSSIAVFAKEIFIIPFYISLGVNGFNFSINMLRNKSKKSISRNSLKARFGAYCFTSSVFTCFILIGVLIETYVIPIFLENFIPAEFC